MTYRRTAMNLDRYIIEPPKAQYYGPVCATCNRVCDGEEIVEGYPGAENDAGQVVTPAGGETCRVRVKHHGAEEVVTFDMGSRLWGMTELSKWLQRHRWFDPLAGHVGK